MKQTRLLMGMPITVEIVDSRATVRDVEILFEYFTHVDNTFSTYKPESEISKFNNSLLEKKDFSPEMQEVFELAEKTKQETYGYFDIYHNEMFDPSGIVKGWAIQNAADMLRHAGFTNFYVEAGGDIQVSGHTVNDTKWKVGIRNPFNRDEIVKVIEVDNHGVATSGTYIRGNHIYNPKTNSNEFDIASLTVIGPNIYDADRYATAAFAMGKAGIDFIYSKIGFEGYMIDNEGKATYTPDFEQYVITG